MTPPLGVSHDSGYVCKLKKMLYGLKQHLVLGLRNFLL
jgi:hypothetical protein